MNATTTSPADWTRALSMHDLYVITSNSTDPQAVREAMAEIERRDAVSLRIGDIVTAQNPGGRTVTGTYLGPAQLTGFVRVEWVGPWMFDGARHYVGTFPASSMRAVETDEAKLARLIEASSGLDPRANEIEFQLRTDLACGRCGQVRATATLYDDTCDENGRGAERLCVDCCDAWA